MQKKAMRFSLRAMLCFFVMFSGIKGRGQILWTSTGGAAWLTGNNWAGSSVPTGTQVAQFGANPTGVGGVGINFNGTTNAGTQTNGQKIQEVGAVEITSSRTSNHLIGNSSSTAGATGQFRLNGATVNSIANTIIRNASSGNLTIQDIQGSGTQTMSLIINGSANNIIIIDGSGSVVISSNIQSATGPISIGGSGSGKVELRGANLYTSLTTLNSTLLQLNRSGGTTIPSTNNVVVNGGTLQISSNQALNDLTLSGGTLTVDAGVTLTINGNYSGAGTIINNGKIVLANSSSFPGATATVSAMNDLEIAGNSVITLNNDVTISGALTFTSGKLSIGSHTLTLSGTTSGASAANSLVGGSTSNLVINGTGDLGGTLFFDQTTDGTTNAINNFTLNRTSSGAAALGNKMVLLSTYTPTAGVLTAGGFLHLRSTASNTARIAAGASGGGYITGNVVTERYISGIGIFGNPSAYNRAYRMLTPMVTTTGTINANWQEGQTNPDVNTIVNTNPGYGTQITGAGGAANGFDPTLSNQSSLYTFNAVTPAWVAATNTNVATLNAKTGYLLYIRGNRSMDMTSTASPLPATNTTLRATGTLLTGTQTFASLQGSGKYNLVTNPFASPVDWAAIYGANSTDFENYYTFWDPNQGSRGAFVTVTAGGTVSAGDATTSIQSGQAFFVKATAGAGSPTLTVSETHKTTSNNIDVFRNGSTEQFRTSLYFNDGFVRRLADGVVNVYDNNYSTEVDGRDALQMANWDEDIAIVRNSNSLSIETRPLIDVADTIFLSVARLKQQPYQWQFDPSSFNAPGLQAYLQDKFLATETPVSLSAQTLVNFTVTTDAASAAADRFRIVFRSSAPLPVKITKVKATDKQTAIQVEWNTLGEFEMDKYLVEKSTDGREFIAVGTVLSKNMATATTYTWLDANRVTGSNYYRIRSISKNGQATVSEVVRVNVGKGKEGITVYPNPIVGDVVAVQLNNVASGKYSIVITNKLGQQVSVTSFDHAGGSASQTISLPKAVTAGIYQLQVIGTGVKYELQIIKN